MITIYNSLTGKKETFTPLKDNEVRMYTCGVTVYDDCHIGHARSLYIFEVIRRYLSWRGFNVTFVRNITDVDDKIINKAREAATKEKIPLVNAFNAVRTRFIRSYCGDLSALQVPPADIEPLATDTVPDMVEFIRVLIEKGWAYAVSGNVYFSVRKFSGYGKLSKKKIDDLFSGVRIEADPDKHDPLDFALWKASKEDEPSWPSPWGPGRPGWHIECSVMSRKYLKTDTIDIHAGGRDLIFPHHENEIAQSEALTGTVFARYWIHHGLLTINNQKMAKSLGNFITIKEVLSKYPADILKLIYLQAHYASPVDFSWEKMEEAKAAYERILILKEKMGTASGLPQAKEKLSSRELCALREQFIAAMDDDFNMPRGLGVIFDLVTLTNKHIDEKTFLIQARDLFYELCGVLDLTFTLKGAGSIPGEPAADKQPLLPDEDVRHLIARRTELRKQKKFKEADEVRDELYDKGIILEDKKDGATGWRRKL